MTLTPGLEMAPTAAEMKSADLFSTPSVATNPPPLTSATAVVVVVVRAAAAMALAAN